MVQFSFIFHSKLSHKNRGPHVAPNGDQGEFNQNAINLPFVRLPIENHRTSIGNL